MRSSQTRRTRFNVRQKEYLTAKFNIGETTRCKADAVVIARDRINGSDTDGERLFNRDEFLTGQQITSFFSRLAAKKSLSNVTDDNDEDVNEAADIERALKVLNEERREFALQHPIVFGCHNICVKRDKLKKKLRT